MNAYRIFDRLRHAALVALTIASSQAVAAIEVVSPEVWTLYRGTTIVQPRVAYPSKAACQAAASVIDSRYRCQSTETFIVRADSPARTCSTPQPATETQTVACPAGSSGIWQQTRTYTAATYPTCWTAGAWSPSAAPAGACAAIVTPPPTGTSTLLSTLLNFAETASRNWNFGDHTVDSQFTANQGLWDYTETTAEPWLFDRPEAWRKLCEITGSQRWCDAAQSDLGWYQARIDAQGIFTPKGNGDTKYSYVHPWSTRADNAAIAKRVYDATVRDWPNSYNPGAGLWTERELWVALKAAIRYHDISGDAAALQRAQAQVNQWDQVAAGRGAPLVTYTQHEGGGPGGTQPSDLVSSPWMSALYFQAAREYIGKVPAAAPQVYKQASDYFDWLNTPANRGFYPGTEAHPQYVGLWFPSYLAGGTTIGEAGPDSGNMDHALDVAGFIAFAIKAKLALGLPTEAAQQRLVDMKATTVRNFENWTRSTTYLPRYRLAPPRKWNWWMHGYYELRVNGGE